MDRTHPLRSVKRFLRMLLSRHHRLPRHQHARPINSVSTRGTPQLSAAPIRANPMDQAVRITLSANPDTASNQRMSQPVSAARHQHSHQHSHQHPFVLLRRFPEVSLRVRPAGCLRVRIAADANIRLLPWVLESINAVPHLQFHIRRHP